MWLHYDTWKVLTPLRPPVEFVREFVFGYRKVYRGGLSSYEEAFHWLPDNIFTDELNPGYWLSK